MKVVEVRVLFRAPRFAQMGYAWRRHVEIIWVERVRRSSQSADGLVDICGTLTTPASRVGGIYFFDFPRFPELPPSLPVEESAYRGRKSWEL